MITYVETQPDANIQAINKKLYNYIDTKQKGSIAKMSIYPMNRWRMYDNFDDGKEIPGRIKYVNLFSLIAWIILIIACINFMNLSTARSEQRAREVGVRKVMGAGKTKLIGQFIGESIFMSLVSAIAAVAIIYLSLTAFNNLVEKQLSVNISWPSHITALFLVSIICGLIAGSYPAFYLSSFKPVYVLKGIKIKNNGSAGYIRKGLVILQFSISVILIISTIIIYQQILHVKDRDLGYDKQDLVYTSLQGKMKEHFYAIKNDLQATGFVKNASLSRSGVLQMGSNTGDFQWEGKDPNKQVLVTVEAVSPEYISTMGMKLKAGRDFYNDIKADSNNVIINDAMAKIMNRKNVLGSILTLHDTKTTIIGVVNDFVYNNMYSPAAPLMLYADTASTNYMTVRFKPNTHLATALPAIEKIMKADNPGYPFEYKFVDEQFNNFFKTETLIGKLASVFSILAIFISCLGLFGLAAYTAERRTKEIGIRKVLGASVKNIVTILSTDFIKLVAIALIISSPLAYMAASKWLESFPYRIALSWWLFGGAALLVIAIALCTVSSQAIKAAIANPAKSLRNE